jgi:phage-related holin
MTPDPITPAEIFKNLMYFPAFLLGMSMHSFSILFVFILLDMITGVWRVGITTGWHAITSRAFINGLASKLLFIFIPLVIAYMGKGINLDLTAFAGGALSLLIVGQAYSIVGNIYTIRSGKKVAEFDVVRIILGQIRNFLDRITRSYDHNKEQ